MTTLVENRAARFEYEILETFEAGIQLLGFETKALKAHRGQFDGSYVTIKNGIALLINFGIPPYQMNNTPKDYTDRRPRTLLLHKKEIEYLAQQELTKGLTIVPISMYNSNNLIKVRLAIVKGKKKYDKRESIKKHDVDMDLKRELRDR